MGTKVVLNEVKKIIKERKEVVRGWYKSPSIVFMSGIAVGQILEVCCFLIGAAFGKKIKSKK